MEKFIAIIDCLWHPKNNVREALKAQGLYVYDMRSWDEGGGVSLETRVFVNYEGSVVTNFEIEDWDLVCGERKAIFDKYAWEEKNNIVTKDFDPELEKQVSNILKSLEKK